MYQGYLHKILGTNAYLTRSYVYYTEATNMIFGRKNEKSQFLVF